MRKKGKEINIDIPIDAKVSCYDGDVGKSTYFIVDLVTERDNHFVLNTDQYNKQFVVPIEKIVDLIAGLTIMALLVPEGTAYAQLAGMPPQTAFYAAPIGLVPSQYLEPPDNWLSPSFRRWRSCQPPY